MYTYILKGVTSPVLSFFQERVLGMSRFVRKYNRVHDTELYDIYSFNHGLEAKSLAVARFRGSRARHLRINPAVYVASESGTVL